MIGKRAASFLKKINETVSVPDVILGILLTNLWFIGFALMMLGPKPDWIVLAVLSLLGVLYLEHFFAKRRNYLENQLGKGKTIIMLVDDADRIFLKILMGEDVMADVSAWRERRRLGN